MKEKFAAQNGKTTLYKFRPFKQGMHKQWVREIVEENKIYFSKRSQLNDPFDLAPAIQLGGYDEDARKELLADARRIWLENEPNIDEADLQRRLRDLSKRDLREFEADARKKALDRMEAQYSIFSLTGNRNHAMQWSHYAEGHTGLSLHFRSDENSVFGTSIKVHYSPVRPVVRFPIVDERDLFEKATLWKGSFWEYEDEYRFTRYPNTDYEDVGLHFISQHATFPPQLLTGVTIGACMSDAETTEVLRLAECHSPKLEVWRALTALTYELVFERIA